MTATRSRPATVSRSFPSLPTSCGEVLPVSWRLVGFIPAVWLVVMAVNYATGRGFRFYLAMSLWFGVNLLLVFFGKGMFDLFLFLLLPSVLLGFVDYFNFMGIRVDMFYLIPAANLIPYCFSGALRLHYPERNRLSRRFPIVPQVALFVFACLVATFPSHVTYKTESLRQIGLIFVLPVFFYAYSVHALKRVANVKQVSAVLVFFAAYYAVILGLLQINWRSQFARIVRNLVIYPEAFMQSMWETMYKEAKITSIFPDAASFGHVLNIAFPVALGMYLLSKRRWERLYYLGGLGLICVGTLITGNRTDLLGLVCSVVLIVPAFALQSASTRKALFQLFLMGVVGVAILMGVRENNSFRRLFMPREWDTHTRTGRIILIKEGVRMFKEHPLTGVGPDHYHHNQFYKDPVTGRWEIGQRPHNLVIKILSETGIIGSIAFCILMVSLFKLGIVTWRWRTHTELDFLCYMYLISCITLIAQGSVENSLFYVQTSSLFWMSVGIWRGRAMEIKTRYE